MLGISRPWIRIPSRFMAFSDQSIPIHSTISNSLCCSSSPLSAPHHQLGFTHSRFRKTKSLVVSCKSSSKGNSNRRSSNGDDHQRDDSDDFVEAFLLVSETVKHYDLRRQGFVDETKWRSSQLVPVSSNRRDPKADVGSIGMGFLQRFQSPTIFLKVVCDGDLLLPIIVGDFAIEKLVGGLREDGDLECPDQFQFLKNVTEGLGYEVKMVRITERVVNTYYSRIYFTKPGENTVLSVDARPSDAINVAARCKVPIFVNKQIVLTDAIKIVYGTWRGNHAKSVYDVSLDSAAEGPDELSEELDLVRNMNIAVKEERYKDAAMWRDKLNRFRTFRQEI